MANFGSIRIMDPSHVQPMDWSGVIRASPNLEYENAILRILHTITKSQVGKQVVHAISHRQEWDSMVIVPYEKSKPNASATMLDPHGGRHKGTIDHFSDKHHHHNIHGSGVGSSTVVQFSPTTWQTENGCHRPGARPDEILIHEMFHGLRQLQGLMHHVKVGHKYDNEEEFFAILIANIYTSDHYPHRHLRSSHHGFHALAGGASPTQAFLASPGNRHRVAKLIGQQHGLCRHIALVPCKFNPIRGIMIEGNTLN